ncbi:MAG: protein translocase subunit SecF [Clostridiaceae bacterium]|nr:protein translocase subunit SecF [Clostridiaceae bacterium]
MYSFYKHRRWFYALSITLLMIGVFTAIFAGIKLDIQFKGGSILNYNYVGTVDLDKAENVIATAINRTVSCQETTSLVEGDETKSMVINVAGDETLPIDDQAKLEEALAAAFPDTTFSLQSSDQVDPFIGREMLINGIWAMLVASVLIIAYVWFSFRSMSGPSAGVMALIALYHDVTLVFFVFVVLRIPLNESLIAVVLSILGFSINDTIVIYDRIRENERIYKGSMTLADLVDLSINQSLTRSINTSLCTFGAVAIAYVFAVANGIESIQEFALPMMIGLISGSYSTICLAGPLWVSWKTRGGRSGY